MLNLVKAFSRSGVVYDDPYLEINMESIAEADTLLQECESFISQANQAMIALPFPALRRIRKWRARRRDDYICSLYINIYPRIQNLERALRVMLGEVIEKKRALRVQARYLEVRLDACIRHNEENLKVIDVPVEEMRTIVNNLADAASAVKSMMQFNTEILKQRHLQTLRNGKSFIPWSKRPAMPKVLTEAELAADPDHPGLNRRLWELRQIRGKIVEKLSVELEKRAGYAAHIDNCIDSRSSLTALIIKESSKDDVVEVPPPFDHSGCDDCGQSREIATDCIQHLTALHEQAMVASKRLRQLVEARELMRDLAEHIETNDGIRLCDAVSLADDRSSLVGVPEDLPRVVPQAGATSPARSEESDGYIDSANGHRRRQLHTNSHEGGQQQQEQEEEEFGLAIEKVDAHKVWPPSPPASNSNSGVES